MLRKLINAIKLPPPYRGPILINRSLATLYLVAWLAMFAHIALWIAVLFFGVEKHWRLSLGTSVVATVIFVVIVIVIRRRIGEARSLPREVAWQLWLGPWDSVGRCVWFPVRFAEAFRTLRSPH